MGRANGKHSDCLSNRVLLPATRARRNCRERQTHGNGRSVVNVALNAEANRRASRLTVGNCEPEGRNPAARTLSC